MDGEGKKSSRFHIKTENGGGGGWISTFLMEAGTTSGCLQTVVQREAFLCREFHIKVSNRNKSTKKKKKEEEKKKKLCMDFKRILHQNKLYSIFKCLFLFI